MKVSQVCLYFDKNEKFYKPLDNEKIMTFSLFLAICVGLNGLELIVCIIKIIIF